jgi:hypothetical protein
MLLKLHEAATIVISSLPAEVDRPVRGAVEDVIGDE